MSANVGEGAKRLGEKLLVEVEVENLSSVLKSLRELELAKHGSETPNISNNFFNIPKLDTLISNPTPPIIELVSPPPSHHPSGAGKTSLVNLIIAHAILPTSFPSNSSLGGHNASIILFDPLHHFSIPRLARVMFDILASKTDADITSATQAEMKNVVSRSLLHVHIFRPQSWSSLLATLRSLPDYLFDSTRHKSTHLRIHSIILEDIDAFTWSIRNSTSAFISTSTSTSTTATLSTASTLLSTSLSRLTNEFSCNIILTSQSTTPTSYRPALPTSWPQNMTVTRLAVRRVEVLKFAPALSVEEAEVEKNQRWDVVQRGRFECWKVGIGAGDGDRFVFRVGDAGVEVEKEGRRVIDEESSYRALPL